MSNNKLAIIILALTAIPFGVLLAMAMEYAECTDAAIFFAGSLQILAQWIIAAILAGEND